MAGSFSHMMHGEYVWSLVENNRDKAEALAECYNIIMLLANGDPKKVQDACRRLNYPDPGIDFKPSDRVLAVMAKFKIADGEDFAEGKVYK